MPEPGLIHWITGEPHARLSARARALLGEPGSDGQVELAALWLRIAPEDRDAVTQAAQAIRPGDRPIALAARIAPTETRAGDPDSPCTDEGVQSAWIEISFQAIASAETAQWDIYALVRASVPSDPIESGGAGQRPAEASAVREAQPMFFREQVLQAVRRAARSGGLLAVMSLEVCWPASVAAAADQATADNVSDLIETRVNRALRAGDVAAPAAPQRAAAVAVAAAAAAAAVVAPAASAPAARPGHPGPGHPGPGQPPATRHARFSVLLPRIGEPQDAVRVASRLQALVSEPLERAGQWLAPTLRTGIALHPWDDQDPEGLLDCADRALAGAVQARDEAPRFFSRSLNALSSDRLTLEATLKGALAAQTFVLRFQPRVDGESRSIVGIETLIRWQHPDRGVISPGGFIDVAEQSRLIIPMGAWVLEQACRQNRCWQQGGLPAVPVSVNVSAVQFRDPGFVSTVERALAAGDLAPGMLELEITETVAMRDVPEAIRTLRALKALGVRIAIDDFGTGFSSLAYLRDFPVDVLKIDRSFIHDVAIDARSASIACAVIDMAARLGVGVVAEGVETEAQRRFLLDNGLREMQGFLFSRPLTADGLEGFWQSSVGTLVATPSNPASLLDAPQMVQ